MKAIIYLLFLILSIQLVASITILQNTSFNPSLSNVTYIVNTTKYGISVAEVNETCLTVNTTVWCNSSSVDTEIYIFLSNVTVAEIPPPTPPPSTGGGISDSSSSGGCWGLAKYYDTCYYINDYGECILGCPTNYTCNLDYDFDSLTGETLDYCSSDTIVITPPTNNTIEKIKDKLKEADTRIEQGIEKVLGISKPPRGQLEMFFVYSYLRFKENVINKIFFGSWILFSVLAFVITISSIEIITKVKKKKKKEKKKF